MTNPYIPPHLRGKVDNFVPGTTSFEDLENGDGITVKPGANRTLSQKQYDQTFNQEYRNKNFEESINGQYGANRNSPSMATNLQNWIGEQGRNLLDWGTSSQGKSVGTAAALSALIGGGLGAYKSYTSDDGSSPVNQGLLYGLLAAGVGGGATKLFQNQFNAREDRLKQASVDVYQVVEDASDLSASERRRCLDALDDLSYSDRRELERSLKTYGGAALGAVVMRFLRGKGLLSTAAGAIIGGMIGSYMSSDLSYNKMGQPRLH